MKQDLIIDMEHDIRVALVTKQPHQITKIFLEAYDVLAAGKRVIFQRGVPGSPPNILRTFTDVADFEFFVKEYCDDLAKSRRPVVE